MQENICQTCGQANISEAIYCQSCGQQLSGDVGEAGRNNCRLSRDEENYIGVNLPYYQNAFSSMRRRKSFISWNWPAFLATENWLFYRKLYTWGIVYIVIASLLICLSALRLLSTMLPLLYFIPVLHNFNSTVPLVIVLIFKIIMGLTGNYIYMRRVEKRVLDGSQLPEPQKTKHLKRYGGTSVLACVLSVIIFYASVNGMVFGMVQLIVLLMTNSQ